MSKRYIYFKILEPDFSQIWDLCRIIANNINFNYRSNSGKIISNFSINSKIPISLCLFSQFLVYFFFSKNSLLPCTTSCGFQTPCPKLEKDNDSIPRKSLDRRPNGKANRPYFIGTFWLPPGGPK